MSASLIYALAGAALFAIGVVELILQPHLLRKIMAFNVMGSSAFLVLVGLGQRDGAPDPVPQAMVLTGIAGDRTNTIIFPVPGDFMDLLMRGKTSGE